MSTHSLFEFNQAFMPYLEHAAELGRSFIQPRYQGKHSLDYLWYGIGAYLYQHPEIRYMVGPVSLSISWPEPAQKMIASFYTTLFGNDKMLALPRLPFEFDSIKDFAPFKKVDDETEYKQAYGILKKEMDDLGVKVPVFA